MKKKNIFLIIFGLIGVVSLVANIILAIELNRARETTNNYKVGAICGDSDISGFNEAISAEDGVKVKDKLKKISGGISAKANYSNDANCSVMVLASDLYNSDADGAGKELENLEKLNSEGHNFDGKIKYTNSLDEIESDIKTLNSNIQVKG